MAASEPRLVFARVGLLLAGAIFLFTVENVWLDPWIRAKSHHRMPSFVPESLSGTWVIAFSVLVMALILAVECQVLLSRDRGLAKWKKVLTGLAVLGSALLVGEWFVATGGRTLVEQIPWPQRTHSVTLTWKASSTKNVRYNVYRSEIRISSRQIERHSDRWIDLHRHKGRKREAIFLRDPRRRWT